MAAGSAGNSARDSAHGEGRAVPAGPLTARAGKGERTRARLLEIAVRRFAADGFRRTSVSDIAREAGLTPAAVYAYFEGKEALFSAAVDADAGALIEEADRAIDDLPVHERWAAILGALLARLDDHPLARRVLGGHEPEVIARLLALPSLAASREHMVARLGAARAAGELGVDVEPATLALGLETLTLALLMGAVQTGAHTDASRAASVVAVVEAALRSPA